jgi:hypothetical protein
MATEMANRHFMCFVMLSEVKFLAFKKIRAIFLKFGDELSSIKHEVWDPRFLTVSIPAGRSTTLEPWKIFGPKHLRRKNLLNKILRARDLKFHSSKSFKCPGAGFYLKRVFWIA